MTTGETTYSTQIDDAVSRIAALIGGRGSLSTGDIAALRRMDPRRPPAAFFKLEGLVLEGQLPGVEEHRERQETHWAAIVSGLAHLGALHRRSQEHRLGYVLAQSAYSELRFVRLLQADSERLVDELPMLARYLSVKGQPVDWTGSARLILSADTLRDGERQRRRLARDYYGRLAQQARH